MQLNESYISSMRLLSIHDILKPNNIYRLNKIKFLKMGTYDKINGHFNNIHLFISSAFDYLDAMINKEITKK